MNHSSLNIGNALGAWLGGLVITRPTGATERRPDRRRTRPGRVGRYCSRRHSTARDAAAERSVALVAADAALLRVGITSRVGRQHIGALRERGARSCPACEGSRRPAPADTGWLPSSSGWSDHRIWIGTRARWSTLAAAGYVHGEHLHVRTVPVDDLVERQSALRHHVEVEPARMSFASSINAKSSWCWARRRTPPPARRAFAVRRVALTVLGIQVVRHVGLAFNRLATRRLPRRTGPPPSDSTTSTPDRSWRRCSSARGRGAVCEYARCRGRSASASAR